MPAVQEANKLNQIGAASVPSAGKEALVRKF
jgi:hypothetical protein